MFEGLFQPTHLLIILGIALLVLDEPAERVAAGPGIASPVALNALGAATAALVLFLYLGASVFPSEMRRTYLREVNGRMNAAIKVSDDPAIDRSLYYSGKRNVFYTRKDGLPIGAVRTFDSLGTRAIGNDSFVRPNFFVGP